MKKQALIPGLLMAALTFPMAGFAESVPALSSEILPPIPMISGEVVKLSPKEAHALRLANEWKGRRDKPRRGEDGSVKYLFGATLPTLICSPLQVCMIQLQSGETVNDLHIGDKVRWNPVPGTLGAGDTQATTIIVKPTDAGLTTNMTVTTDRRIYTIKLVSSSKDWMPVVSFDYPDDIQKIWAAHSARQQQAVRENTLPTGQNLANLDFNFRISGKNPSWKPVRVYTDGQKTYIQFPSAHFNESPALVALGRRGEELVNYRLIGDRYVVDKVLDRAALIVGVGRAQTKVVITRTEGRK